MNKSKKENEAHHYLFDLCSSALVHYHPDDLANHYTDPFRGGLLYYIVGWQG